MKAVIIPSILIGIALLLGATSRAESQFSGGSQFTGGSQFKNNESIQQSMEKTRSSMDPANRGQEVKSRLNKGKQAAADADAGARAPTSVAGDADVQAMLQKSSDDLIKSLPKEEQAKLEELKKSLQMAMPKPRE